MSVRRRQALGRHAVRAGGQAGLLVEDPAEIGGIIDTYRGRYVGNAHGGRIQQLPGMVDTMSVEVILERDAHRLAK